MPYFKWLHASKLKNFLAAVEIELAIYHHLYIMIDIEETRLSSETSPTVGESTCPCVIQLLHEVLHFSVKPQVVYIDLIPTAVMQFFTSSLPSVEPLRVACIT